MNVKKFIVGGIVGGIINFLLGWLFYGILFKDIYPPGESMNMTFIFLGCMTAGFFVSYIFNRFGSISNVMTGLTTGAVVGFFTSLSMNLFMYSNKEMDCKNMAMDIAISIIITAIMGIGVAFSNQKL